MTLAPPNSAFVATEGATASGVVAIISDPASTDPASDFLATIDWGDGTTTAGTVTGAVGTIRLMAAMFTPTKAISS